VKKISVLMLQWLTFLVGTNAMAADTATNSFTADPKIQKVAEAYAEDAVDYSAKRYGVKLDWSDQSIGNVELVLSKMSASYSATNPKPTTEQVMSFAKGFGSYVGEVYRRNHGATWGMVTLGGQSFPGLKTASGINFWPWGRAFERITHGSENNVADYYAALLARRSK
jgi:hypothetical protein